MDTPSTPPVCRAAERAAGAATAGAVRTPAVAAREIVETAAAMPTPISSRPGTHARNGAAERMTTSKPDPGGERGQPRQQRLPRAAPGRIRPTQPGRSTQRGDVGSSATPVRTALVLDVHGQQEQRAERAGVERHSGHDHGRRPARRTPTSAPSPPGSASRADRAAGAATRAGRISSRRRDARSNSSNPRSQESFAVSGVVLVVDMYAKRECSTRPNSSRAICPGPATTRRAACSRPSTARSRTHAGRGDPGKGAGPAVAVGRTRDTARAAVRAAGGDSSGSRLGPPPRRHGRPRRVAIRRAAAAPAG